MLNKRRFLYICQILLLSFIWFEINSGDLGETYDDPPKNMRIVICRFLCAIFLHITLLDPLRQAFDMMKYAINHPWKFASWHSAFRIGLLQMIVIVSTEVVNVCFMLTQNNIVDIVSYFVAILIISQFDDFLFLTVKSSLIG